MDLLRRLVPPALRRLPARHRTREDRFDALQPALGFLGQGPAGREQAAEYGHGRCALFLVLGQQGRQRRDGALFILWTIRYCSRSTSLNRAMPIRFAGGSAAEISLSTANPRSSTLRSGWCT
jgi:hypothetical protein